MIRNVIFDIGNVLIRYDWKSVLEQFPYSEETKKKVANAVFLSKTWNDRDQGGRTEEEYLQEFIANDPSCEKETREVMQHCLETCVEEPFAKDWVCTIKTQGYRVYLLSNYSKYMFEVGAKKFAFYPEVDGGVISYEILERKPFKPIYETLLAKYDLNPEECVFLDDREENIQTAAELGFHTIQVTDHEAAVAGLEALGIHS